MAARARSLLPSVHFFLISLSAPIAAQSPIQRAHTAVVGSGIGGLSASVELMGSDFLTLECKAHPGGRMYSVTNSQDGSQEPIFQEEAAHFVVEHYHRLFRLSEMAGLSKERDFLQLGPVVAMFKDDRLIEVDYSVPESAYMNGAFGRTPRKDSSLGNAFDLLSAPYSWVPGVRNWLGSTREQVNRLGIGFSEYNTPEFSAATQMANTFRRIARDSAGRSPVLFSQWADGDYETALQFQHNEYGGDYGRDLVQSSSTALFGNNLPELSRAAIEWMIQVTYRRSKNLDRWYVPKRGMSSITLPLAAMLGDRIRYGFCVSNIERHPEGGVLITSEKGERIWADVAIVTVPAPVAKPMFSEDSDVITPAQKKYLHRKYHPTIQLNVTLPTRYVWDVPVLRKAYGVGIPDSQRQRDGGPIISFKNDLATGKPKGPVTNLGVMIAADVTRKFFADYTERSSRSERELLVKRLQESVHTHLERILGRPIPSEQLHFKMRAWPYATAAMNVGVAKDLAALEKDQGSTAYLPVRFAGDTSFPTVGASAETGYIEAGRAKASACARSLHVNNKQR